MNYYGLVIVVIMSALIATYFKSAKSEYGMLISVSICIIIMFFGLSKFEYVIQSINTIRNYIGIDSAYIKIILKIIGISYLTEFASDICKDCGYSSMSNQIQVAGKLTVLCLSLPVILAMFDTINGMLGDNP